MCQLEVRNVGFRFRRGINRAETFPLPNSFYWNHKVAIVAKLWIKSHKTTLICHCTRNGRNWIRTSDLYDVNVAL